MNTRRQELGAFLQAMRKRSAPEAFGFATGSRRRTQGLRREEAAQLAGISPTWYTWIEQGREVKVSPEVLDRLAQSLRLTGTERAYLFEMAGRRDPHAAVPEADGAPETLADLLADITIPAYLMGRYWDILAWNRQAAELFAGWLDQPQAVGSAPPNMLRFVFLQPHARHFVVDWETRARRITAEFRADCRSRFEEPALQRLVEELKQASPEFSRFWKQHDVLERQGGERSFHHPRRGLVAYRQITLRPVEQEHLKLVVLSPAQVR
ncbi:Transcriptional regulator [Georgfuchsia toluolica]|uniref:Transcriptional regulator n=1 Tax=Georgfuchsia toluolica TaxID=424218 RepID=A0A916J4G0_9PROT|nr:helix-turn-helix transcriptional regulator [Georgfuchsia toluolica]CAG4884407.1 Transcriptional regulator [Georgfuchsia toluolica]